tara:strand:- start:328 stop:600 length:273 start_codon:yes stop_codon:yes gene_type:complete
MGIENLGKISYLGSSNPVSFSTVEEMLVEFKNLDSDLVHSGVIEFGSSSSPTSSVVFSSVTKDDLLTFAQSIIDTGGIQTQMIQLDEKTF